MRCGTKVASEFRLVAFYFFQEQLCMGIEFGAGAATRTGWTSHVERKPRKQKSPSIKYVLFCPSLVSFQDFDESLASARYIPKEDIGKRHF